jgi:hypothetical protein
MDGNKINGLTLKLFHRRKALLIRNGVQTLKFMEEKEPYK